MNDKYDVFARVILVVTGACLLAPLSYAQDAGGGTGFALEEIVVTARKREEGLQETPLSIAAFTEHSSGQGWQISRLISATLPGLGSPWL